jgi:hypothetical protein
LIDAVRRVIGISAVIWLRVTKLLIDAVRRVIGISAAIWFRSINHFKNI